MPDTVLGVLKDLGKKKKKMCEINLSKVVYT